MGSLQKVLLSLLISVIVAAGFSIVAFSGFFSYIESAFYDNRVERETAEQLSDINDALERYHQSIIERFTLFLEEPSVRNAFMVNQSREDILQRQNLLGGLEEQLPELEYVRFVGLEEGDLWFSSLESDIASREATRIVYAPSSELENPLPNRADLFGERPLFTEAENNAFMYTLAVVDNFGIERGRALFAVHVSGVRGYLIRQDLIRANQQVAMLSGGRLLVNARRFFQDETYEKIAEAIQSEAEYSTIATEGEDAFLVFTSSGPFGVDTALLVPEERFELSPLMQGVLLAAVFFSTLLLVHLLLNLRQDPAAVLSERVRRFQAEVIRELIREGGLQSRGLVQQQLERRREELDRRIKKGLGRVGKETQAELEEIVETNWKELGRLLGTPTTSQAQIEDVSLSKIEEIIDRTVRRYSLGAASGGGSSAPPREGAAQVQTVSEPPSTNEPPPRRPVEVEEAEETEEELGSLEEEPEELGALVEAEEEPEEHGTLEEAEEIEEAEELADLEEEPEELAALEEAEEIEEAEAAEEREGSEEEGAEEALEEVDEVEVESEPEPRTVEEVSLEEVHAPETPLTTPLEREEEELEESEEALPFVVGDTEEYAEMTPLEALEAREEASLKEAAQQQRDVEEVETGEAGEEESVEEIEELGEVSEELLEEETVEEISELEEPEETVEEAPEELEEIEEIEQVEAIEEVDEAPEVEPVSEEPRTEASEQEEEEVAEYLEAPEELPEAAEAEVEPAQHRPGSLFFSGFSFGERFSAGTSATAFSEGQSPSDQSRDKSEVEVIRGLEYFRIEPSTPSNAYEVTGYDDLLEIVFAQNTVIREEGGLAEIESAAYSQSQERTAVDRRFRSLVNDVLHKYSDSVGVSQLFGGIDALFVDEEERGDTKLEEERTGPTPMGARRIHDAFTQSGFDIDRFLRRRGDTTGRLYSTLIELSRTWRARTCALLQYREGRFRAGVTLGLEDPWREALNLGDESNLAQEVLLRRMVLHTRLPLNRFVDFATSIRQGEVSGVQQALFIPARYNNSDAYLMIGYDIQIPSIEAFVTRFINAAATR